MRKQLQTVWPGWRERAKSAKKDGGKTDVELATEVSELLGYQVGRSMLNHWLTGRTIPKLSEFMALVEALGADPGDLLFQVKVIPEYAPKSPTAAQVMRQQTTSPEYLRRQAERLRRFRAKKRRITIRV